MDTKRKTLIDLRYLNSISIGFGQLCLSYGDFFLKHKDEFEDLDITLFVPENYVGKFGNHVKYLTFSKKYKFFPFLFPKFNIAHSTTQLMKYIPLNSNTTRIITIHDLYYLFEINNKAKKGKEKRLKARLYLADIVTVISKHTLNNIKKYLDTSNKPLIVNYNGIKNTTNQSDSKPQFINNNRKFFFTIGQVIARKNFHVLLDMMKLMPEYDLYISGKDSTKYEAMLKDRIAKENISNVFITGIIKQEEKIWLHKHCTAFLFPSIFEGFGIPIIEAMRFNKPAISSPLTSPSEIGSNFSFYWYNFEAKYMKDIVLNAIDKYYNDSEYRNAQIDYALSYSIERHVKQFLDIYRNIDLKKDGNTRKTIKTLRNYLIFFKS